MKVITIDAPWAWAIVHGHKRVENRTWRTVLRGPLAIHAGRSRRSDDDAAAVFASLGIVGPTPDELASLRGRVLGQVDVLDVVDYPNAGGDGHGPQGDPHGLVADPFAKGPRCWIFGNARAYPHPPLVTGQQGLWTLATQLA